jgi:hypothetical protein
MAGPVVGSLIYSLLCVLLDVLATRHGDQAKLQVEVLALRRQVQVLERQVKRVHWSAGDAPGGAALVRRKWAADRGGAGRRSQPSVVSWSCGWRGQIQAGATSVSAVNC